MKQTRFNTGWRVFDGIVDPFATLYGGAPVGTPVTLPHDPMIAEKRDPACPSATQSGFYPAKTYTYTKTFFVPAEWEGQKQFLEFEGVMSRAGVYINEQFAGHNDYGYAQFFVDLTPFLRYGEENTVKVVASHSDLASRWYSGSGIYRDVNLHTGGKAWIVPESLRMTTEYIEEDYALVRVEFDVNAMSPGTRQLKVNVRFFDNEKQQVAIAETGMSVRGGENEPAHAALRVTVSNPKCWSPDTPALYRCLVTLSDGDHPADEAEDFFGIRTLRLDARGGLRINGQPVKLRGTCIHHDNGIIGAATLEDAEEFRARRMKEAGFNAIRSAHHPMGKAMLRVCDRIGLLVMDELSDMWNVPKNCYDFSFSFDGQVEEQIRRVVAKDYNHPCVVLYSTGNEIPEIGRADGRLMNRRIVSRFHALDATRYTTAGINGLLAAGNQLMGYMMGLGVTGTQAAQEAEKAKSDAGGSEALNAAMAQMQQQRMDAFSASDMLTNCLEDASGALDVSGFNYMTSRHVLEHERHSDRMVVGSETYPTEIARLWPIVEQNPHVIGDFTWTGYDYLGEAGIGIFHYESEEKRQGFWPDRLAYCGDINLNGYRRPASYLREIAYGLRTAPYIAVDRPEHYGQRHDMNGWKYGDAVDSWTWRGFEDQPVRIRVLAKADEVELKLNGESLGRGRIGEVEGLTAYFETRYQPGTLEAIAWRDGQEVGRSALTTADEPVRLAVSATREQLPADGSGVSFLVMDAVDARGQVNRQAKIRVKLSVEGAGELAGFGSADPSSENSYQDSVCETFDGRVMAAIRSADHPGTVTVRINAEECPEEVVTISVK